MMKRNSTLVPIGGVLLSASSIGGPSLSSGPTATIVYCVFAASVTVPIGAMGLTALPVVLADPVVVRLAAVVRGAVRAGVLFAAGRAGAVLSAAFAAGRAGAVLSAAFAAG